MPVKNSYEAAKEIRAVRQGGSQNNTVVAMSADAFSDDIQRALAAGNE